MQTKLQLLRNEAADVIRVYDFEWWHQALMVVGAFTLLVLFFAGFLYLVTKDEIEEIDRRIDAANERVLRDLCTCRVSPKCAVHSAQFFRGNHTSTLSIVEMRSVPTEREGA